MVNITMVNWGWPGIGWMTRRTSAMPSRNMPTIATGAATQNDQPPNFISSTPPDAPSIISSPWAKLTVSVAL